MRRAVTFTVAAAFVIAACSSDGGGSVEAFCDSVQEFADLQDVDLFEVPPDEFPDQVAELRDVISAVAEDAPSEISDDAQLAADNFIQVLDALADVDPSDQAAVEEAFAPLGENDPEVEAASDRVNEFSMAECGIDLDEGE